MNMSNKEDKSNNDKKDEIIKERFSKDKYVYGGDGVKEEVFNEFKNKKMKQKKSTIGQRRFILFLIVILTVSIAGNVYLLKDRDNKKVATSKVEKETHIEKENKPKEEKTKVEKKKESKNILEDEVVAEENTEKNENVVSEEEVQERPNKNEIDEEILQKEILSYAMTIGRFGEETSELEKNTILLLIANTYFNNNTSKGSLDISSNNKYSMLAKNVHLFLKELNGMEVDGYLKSYVNYMDFNVKSKFYSSGANSIDLQKESYEISSYNISSKSDDEIKVIANLTRKSIKKVKEKTKYVDQPIQADYSIEVTFGFNDEYTYLPYSIKEYKAELKPGQSDNVDRLVDVSTKNKKN